MSIDYEAAEDAYMKVTGNVSLRGMRDAIIAALGDDVLYKFDPVQSAMQDTRLVKQAIDQGVLVQVWPEGGSG